MRLDKVALALALALSVGPLTTTATVAAQDAADDAERARSLFERGVAAFDRGAHEEALALFRESYDVRRSQSVLYNIAMTERRMGDGAAALAHLYEWLGNDEGRRPARTGEVETEIEELAPRFATLRLVREPPDLVASTGQADEADPPMTTGGIVVLAPGTHTLRFEAVGYAKEERVLSLAAGSDETIRVTLLALDDGGSRDDQRPSATDGSGLVFTWVAAGLALAFGGLAVGAWLAGDAEHQSLKDACAPSCSQDALSTLKMWDALTTAGIVGAGVATAAAITLGLVESGVFSGEDDDAVSVGPTGVSYRRRF